MSIEVSISNYTFPFSKLSIHTISDNSHDNEIIQGQYIFEQHINALRVKLSDYTLKGTKKVLEELSLKFNDKKLYIIGITYMNTETLEPIDTQIGITGKLKFGENHLQGAERELIEEFGSYLYTSVPVSISDNGKTKIFGFNCSQCFPIDKINIICDKIKNTNSDDRSRRVGTIIAGELKDLINVIMNIKFKPHIEKDIYGIKLLALDDILKISSTQLIIN